MSKVKIELPEGDSGDGGQVSEGQPQDTQDLTAFIQTLLQQMQDKFQDMSDQMIKRIDEMGARIDDLEQNISDLMTQAGVDEPKK